MKQRFARMAKLLATGEAWPSDLPPLTARQIYEELRDAYVPVRTPIRRPVLIKASHGEGSDEAASQQVQCPQLGWSEFIDGPLQVSDVPGGHSSMLHDGSGRCVGRLLSQALTSEQSPAVMATRDRVSVLVITVSYKTAALVERSLLALAREAGRHPDIDLRAYVIDNASGDAPQLRAAVAKHGLDSWVTVAESKVNGGFAYGNNAGFHHAYANGTPPDYFLLLNPDAEVMPGAISALTRFLEQHPEAGMAGSQLFFDDGSAWPYAFRFPSIWSEIEEGLSFGPASRFLSRHTVARRMGDQPEAVDWVPGASLMVRRTAIDELGGLDERYFLYYEELDFCLKLQRAGWRCYYVPDSKVIHVSGQSSGITDRKRKGAQLPGYWFESRRRYFVKNHGLRYAAQVDTAAFIAHALGRLKRRLAGKTHENIQNWLRDFARHTSLRPKNQALPPSLEFELERLLQADYPHVGV